MKKINLRREAKGRECLVRIPSVCNGNPETTVLAHLNNKALFGAGMGLKVPDMFGAWACSDCHDVCDGRKDTPSFTGNEIYEMHVEGVLRTQNQLLKEGKL
jgi:hypothetical protein